MGTAPGMSGRTQHVLIVGGGYVGMYTAFRLQKKLRGQLSRGEVEITVVDPQSYMTYQPFLPEAAAGSLEPRHVVVPLRRVLKRVNVLNAWVTGIDQTKHEATVQVVGSTGTDDVRTLSYDVLVYAPGRSRGPCRSPASPSAALGSRPSERRSTCATM